MGDSMILWYIKHYEEEELTTCMYLLTTDACKVFVNLAKEQNFPFVLATYNDYHHFTLYIVLTICFLIG